MRDKPKSRSVTCAWVRKLLALTAVALFAGGSTATAEVIRWRAGPAPFTRLNRAELADTILILATRPDARHVVVQFDRPVGPAMDRQVRQAGMKLLGYLGNNAFFASFADGDIDAERLSAVPSLTGIQGIQPAWKLDPRILAGETPTWAVVAEDAGRTIVAVYVLFHPDVPLFDEAGDAAARHGARIRSELESINGMVVELPASNISALADEDAVQWIEWPLPRMSEINNRNRQITEADIVQASPYNLDGAGVTVLVYDGGSARASHVDFEGRLTLHDASAMSSHSTHVAGTIGGAGVASPTYKGMAPGVTMLSYGFEFDDPNVILYSNPGDLEGDYNEAINVYGADIANNSIGSNVEINNFACDIQGDYGVTSALIDSIVTGSLGDPFRVVWAAGNERQGDRCDIEGFGDYYSTAPPGGAKNAIIIGATNSNNDSMTTFSSWGPVDDGRLKPDVVAPGCQTDDDGGVTSCSSGSDTAYSVKCGTSMAAPTVTGLAALLIEDFRTQFPSRPDPRNSTLKALFAHNGEDIENVGPDYKTGYGSVRIQRTIDFMRTGKFVEDQVDQGERFASLVEIDSGVDELKITVAWDDVPGTPNVHGALVNDLDLRVFDASSDQFHPWTLDPESPGVPAVRTAPDHLNNIEQVLIDDPEPGVYRVEVFGFGVPQGPQSFSLCASGPIVSCSSQGIIAFDRPSYACRTTADVQVIDCDLNTDDSIVEWLTVTVTSTSEPEGETLLLIETGADTADFRGTMPFSNVDDVGVLMANDGDVVTATYIDADDGFGNHDLPIASTATIDCAAPVISNVQVVDIHLAGATVTFETDQWATGVARIGSSCASVFDAFTEPGFRRSHEILLTDLTENTEYYFVVDAFDLLGNPSQDSNGGLCYSFFTRAVVFGFPLDADPGWSTDGQWAFGQPTGGGSLEGDPTSGFTGINVYGYNLDGDYTNDLPATYLTTTALDLSLRTQTQLQFQRWLVIEPGIYDDATLEVSNDGIDWVTVWDHTGNYIMESYWTLQVYDISEIADGQPEVYVRWGMGPTNGVLTLPGWNIDDIRITASGVPPTPTCDDGVQNQGEDRIDCGGPCPPCACTSDPECGDGLSCNGSETCDSYGHCQNGTAVDCDDGMACTEDSCNETTDSCENIPSDALCDNGLYCDGIETCDPLLDCQPGDPVDCTDGVDCTIDSCNEATDSCDNDPSNALCDNGLYCDGNETCDPLLDCRAGTSVDCDDGVICTVDSCNEETDSCDNVPNDASCDDGLYCDGSQTCDPLLDCQTGTPVDCHDGVGCTEDSCNEETDSCDNVPNDAMCSDDLFCDGVETCHPILDCQEGTLVDCDDGVDCTIDVCNEETDSCDHPANAGFCDNGLYCDGIETCDPLLDCRAGMPVDCDDGVSCTVDVCNEQTDSCDNVPNDTLCGNGLFCDGVETCDPILDCQDGTAVDCNDGVECTEDSCNESADSCNNVPNDVLCGNNLFCDGVETCHPILDCQDGTPVDCNDDVDCTEDSCNEFTDSCENVPVDVHCDNGLFCDGSETCDPLFGCQPGDYPCPPDKLCREFDDQCVDCLVNADCTDGDPCNGVEICKLDGTCFSRLSADCNENDTEDFCDIDAGTSLDCQPNGIPDECDLHDCAGNPACDDCNANDIPDGCDVATGFSPDVNGNGIPDECEVDQPAPQPGPLCSYAGDCTGAYNGADCVAGMCYVPKNRYLSLDPTVIPVPVAYQVELTESAPYPEAVGRTWWVDEPVCYDYPNGDVVGPTPTTCAGPDRFAWVAKVTATAVTRVWNETPVHITGCPVVPEATFRIRASHDSGISFSEPLLINTAHNPQGDAQSWADVTGGPVPGMPGVWLPPERSTNLADVGHAVRTFENRTTDTGSPPRVWVDLEINQVINLADVQFVVNAFEGTAYSEIQLELIGTNPADCP